MLFAGYLDNEGRCNGASYSDPYALAIATQAPDEFAYNFMKEPVYMWQ